MAGLGWSADSGYPIPPPRVPEPRRGRSRLVPQQVSYHDLAHGKASPLPDRADLLPRPAAPAPPDVLVQDARLARRRTAVSGTRSRTGSTPSAAGHTAAPHASTSNRRTRTPSSARDPPPPGSRPTAARTDTPRS